MATTATRDSVVVASGSEPLGAITNTTTASAAKVIVVVAVVVAASDLRCKKCVVVAASVRFSAANRGGANGGYGDT